MSEKQPPPWYRQGWPWFLIALPATAVVASIITLVIAVQTFDGMVVDDYYKEGRAIVQTIERSERAAKLGLAARLQVRSESLIVELTAAEQESLPAQIVLTVAHPTRGGQDQVLVLSGRGGVFQGALAPLSTGRWLFQIEDAARNWRMNGAAYLPTESDIRIVPASS